GVDGVLRRRAVDRHGNHPALDCAGSGLRPRHWSVAGRAQRALSGHPIHVAVSDANLAVCDADCILVLSHPRAMAPALRAEPDGRCRRGVPVGAARLRIVAGHDVDGLDRGGARDSDQRAVLLPHHRADVCRRGLMHAVIEAKELSKLYRLGQRERYGALRDSLANALAAPAKWLRGAKGSSDPAAIETIWALKDVSVAIEAGESIGII